MTQTVRHIAGIAEIVEDVDAAVKFYRDVLGLAVNHEEGSNYATIDIPGILHFGIWHRSTAAESAYGDASAVDKIPLGFSIGFEVDSVESASKSMESKGWKLAQSPKTEPWGQITSRYLSPSGALCETSETPWAREVTHNVQASGSDSE